MKYRLNVSAQALADIEEIHAGMEEFSRSAADRLAKLLESSIEALADFPKRHPVAPQSKSESVEIRHVIVSEYRILFRILGDVVHILQVRHGARAQLKPGDLN